jgi:hypothetical protein
VGANVEIVEPLTAQLVLGVHRVHAEHA